MVSFDRCRGYRGGGATGQPVVLRSARFGFRRPDDGTSPTPTNTVSLPSARWTNLTIRLAVKGNLKSFFFGRDGIYIGLMRCGEDSEETPS